jgi:hypothetical protein
MLQNIDLSNLSENQLDTLFSSFPNLESLLNLPAARKSLDEYSEEILRLQERGGVAFLQQFDAIRSAIDDLIETEVSTTVAETRNVKIKLDGKMFKRDFTIVAGQSVEQA